MSDAPRRPELLVPDPRVPKVLSLDQAREQDEAPKRRPMGKGGDLITRDQFNAEMDRVVASLNEQMAKSVTTGVLAIGEKLYAELGQHSTEFLEAMEVEIEGRILSQLANERRERSWYGRFRRLLVRLGAKEQEPVQLVTNAPDMERAMAEVVANHAEEATDGE